MNGREQDFMFNKMVSEATEEVANQGWKKASNNAVTLASFGVISKLISNRLHNITRPFYWTAGAVGAAVVTYIINAIL